jgi:hypothetical protein
MTTTSGTTLDHREPIEDRLCCTWTTGLECDGGGHVRAPCTWRGLALVASQGVPSISPRRIGGALRARLGVSRGTLSRRSSSPVPGISSCTSEATGPRATGRRKGEPDESASADLRLSSRPNEREFACGQIVVSIHARRGAAPRARRRSPAPWRAKASSNDVTRQAGG